MGKIMKEGIQYGVGGDSAKIEKVSANVTQGTNYIDYPNGFNSTNTFMISAKCYTKYSSWVDYGYDTFAYWGELTFMSNNIRLVFNHENTNSVELLLYRK